MVWCQYCPLSAKSYTNDMMASASEEGFGLPKSIPLQGGIDVSEEFSKSNPHSLKIFNTHDVNFSKEAFTADHSCLRQLYPD